MPTWVCREAVYPGMYTSGHTLFVGVSPCVQPSSVTPRVSVYTACTACARTFVTFDSRMDHRWEGPERGEKRVKEVCSCCLLPVPRLFPPVLASFLQF